MSDDVLVAGARRTLPSWAPLVGVLLAVVAVLVWAVVTFARPVLDGHGTGPTMRVPTLYQPYLGRPVY